MAIKRETADNVKADMEKRFGKAQEQQPGKDDMKQCNFRMKETDIDRLTRHFEDNGLLFSQGIRKVLREYMHKNGLI